MELFKYSNNLYYTSYETMRDRPRLGYIKGDKYSIAIDAGHSDAHLFEFYDLLKKEQLPLPDFTILTHWHWDHTFAMHAVHGSTIANKKTAQYLSDFISNRSKENDEKFLSLDPSIAKEYADNKEIIVVLPDIIFENKLKIDIGGQVIEIFECPSPHSDDATFIYVPNEKVLFIGDGKSGTFPDWKVNPEMAKKLADFIEPYDIDCSIGGHWENETKEEMIESMKEHF